MTVVQRLNSSRMRRCVGALGLTEVITDTEYYDVTFEARPLCNSTRCTAL